MGIDGRSRVRDTWSMLRYPFTFPKVSGRLVRRVNRFVVEADINGRREQAYLANPGRLWELLLPGTALLLSPALSRGRLPYTVLACQKDDQCVLLHTHLTNSVVRSLIDAQRLPPYRDYRVVRTEPAVGKHRFDLLLEQRLNGKRYYLEIKSVTLFENQTAMFPDAVTERGTAHLRLLGEMAEKGLNAGCLFVIMNPHVKYFLPAYHVDYNFARTMLDVKDSVQLRALALGFDASFSEVISVAQVKIPYHFVSEELQDRGSYLLLLYMDRHKTVPLQQEESMELEKGCYVFTGAASENLIKETARHKQKRKKKGQSIDYLAAAAEKITPVPIITGENIEISLAARLEAIADATIPFPGGKGTGRMFFFAADPLRNRAFIELVLHYRIGRPEQRLLALKNIP